MSTAAVEDGAVRKKSMEGHINTGPASPLSKKNPGSAAGESNLLGGRIALKRSGRECFERPNRRRTVLGQDIKVEQGAGPFPYEKGRAERAGHNPLLKRHFDQKAKNWTYLDTGGENRE